MNKPIDAKTLTVSAYQSVNPFDGKTAKTFEELTDAQLEAKIAQLGEQAQTDSAARAYAEGALQSARRDRLAMQRELVALKAPRGESAEPVETAIEPEADAGQGAEESDGVVVRIAS